MKDIQVRRYYKDFMGDKFAVHEFATLINEETVILYSQLDRKCLVISQSEDEEIDHYLIYKKDLMDALKEEMVGYNLRSSGFSPKYTLKRIEPNRSYIFVSDTSKLSYDISLMKDETFDGWHIDPEKFFKVEQIIQLGDGKGK